MNHLSRSFRHSLHGLLTILCILFLATAGFSAQTTKTPSSLAEKTAKKETPEKEKPAAKTPAKTSAKNKTEDVAKKPDPGATAKASEWGTYVPTPVPKTAPVKKQPVKKPVKGEKNAPEEETVVEKTLEERNQERFEHFRTTGIRLWPELSEEDLAEIDKKQREYLESIRVAFPQNQLHYYETAHFIYVTDAPADIARDCCLFLEAGYANLSEIFSIPPDAQFWRGKCIVVAFAREQHFLEFEAKFYQNPIQAAGAAGLAHLSSSGDVLISLFYGNISRVDARWGFVGTLIHESAHGFLHRYKSAQRLPVWLDEGIAVYLTGAIVTKDQQMILKQKSALKMMQQNRTLDGLLTTTGRIEAWQYGAASGMVSFLLKSKQGGIGQMINQIKDGTDWKDALKDVYGWTPDQFVIVFGNTYNIPGLRP